MAFFEEIIRDSRRRITHSLSPAPIGERASVVLADGLGILDGARRADLSHIPFREEGAGYGGSTGRESVHAGAGARQVAGPSPAEHTKQVKPQRVTTQGFALSDSVTRKQTGQAIDRTVTGDLRIDMVGSLDEGTSSDSPVTGSSEVSVGVLRADDAMPGARKVSVETQERRQAGVMPRAGSAAPPEPFSLSHDAPAIPKGGAASVAHHSMPVEDAGEPGRTPAYTPEGAIGPESSAVASIWRADQPTGDRSTPCPLPIKDISEPERSSTHSLHSANALELSATTSTRQADRVMGNYTLDRDGVKTPDVPRLSGVVLSHAVDDAPEVDPAGDPVGPDSSPATASAPTEAEVRRSPAFLERDTFRPRGNGKMDVRGAVAPSEPQVRIGLIEVVVDVPPMPAERPRSDSERPRAELASRHYLRNI